MLKVGNTRDPLRILGSNNYTLSNIIEPDM